MALDVKWRATLSTVVLIIFTVGVWFGVTAFVYVRTVLLANTFSDNTEPRIEPSTPIYQQGGDIAVPIAPTTAGVDIAPATEGDERAVKNELQSGAGEAAAAKRAPRQRHSREKSNKKHGHAANGESKAAPAAGPKHHATRASHTGPAEETSSIPTCRDKSVCVWDVHVVNVYPHDPKAYTQGLLYLGDDTLYESTGLYGKSEVRKVALKTGAVLAHTPNERRDFGEGLAYYKGFFWQLTWRTLTVYQYRAEDLHLVGMYRMPSEFDWKDGWGLASTSDGLAAFHKAGEVPSDEELYVTDSGTKLYRVVFDGKELSMKGETLFRLQDKKIIKTPGGKPLEMANELELVRQNELWANIYHKDCIAQVDPHTARVFGWIMGKSLRKYDLGPQAEVFNGIALDRQGERIFVTGKLWSKLFEVKLVPSKIQGDEAERECRPNSNIFHPARPFR